MPVNAVAEEICFSHTELAFVLIDYESIIIKTLETKFEMFEVCYMVWTLNEEFVKMCMSAYMLQVSAACYKVEFICTNS